MPRQRPPRYKMREIVTILPNETALAEGVAGLTGAVCGYAPLHGGEWEFAVAIPCRRGMVYDFVEHDLEGTGRWRPKEKDHVDANPGRPRNRRVDGARRGG